MHLNELNRTRPHLNKRRIGSRSISSSLCFPSPPLGVTVHAVRRHVFPSLPCISLFLRVSLKPAKWEYTSADQNWISRRVNVLSPLLFNNLPMIRNRETDIFERFIIIEKVKNDRAKKGKEKL